MSDFEYREEIYRNIHNMKPSWWMEWGVSIILLFFVSLLVLGYLIQYPDIISAEVRLSAQSSVATMPSKVNATISKMMVKDGDSVSFETPLLVFESTASYEHIRTLKTKINTLKTIDNIFEFYIKEKKKQYKLGTVQQAWDDLLDLINDFEQIVVNKQYEARIHALKREKAKLIVGINNLTRILKIDSKLSILNYQDYVRDSLLLSQSVISKADYNERKKNYLQGLKLNEVERQRLNSYELDLLKNQNQIEDLIRSKNEINEKLKRNIREKLGLLSNKIEEYYDLFVIKSPIEGTVHFLEPLAKNQFIKSGQIILTISPLSEKFIATLKIPFASSGKVKVGQTVNLKLADYPEYEFGFLTGEVTRLSKVAAFDYYPGMVTLKNNNVTSYGKNITIHENSKANAEIITQKRNILERIFEKLIYVFKK